MYRVVILNIHFQIFVLKSCLCQFTLYISTRFTVRYLLQFSMQKILAIVLLILSILCVHAELKLKLQNISSCVVNFTAVKD